VWLWRRETSFRLKGAALLIGALLSSPYVLDYDFIVFGMALALLVAHGIARGFLPWEKTLIAFAWFAPLCARTLAQTILLPLGFLTLATVFVWVIVRARAEAAQARHPGIGEPHPA
jgi:hypothetical protein